MIKESTKKLRAAMIAMLTKTLSIQKQSLRLGMYSL